MDFIDDPKLSELLKEWRVPGAPQSLDARVLGTRKRWWRVLLTGSIRVPVPVVLAIAAILLTMAAVLVHKRPSPPTPSSINLADFQPVRDFKVRVIRGHDETR